MTLHLTGVSQVARYYQGLPLMRLGRKPAQTCQLPNQLHMGCTLILRSFYSVSNSAPLTQSLTLSLSLTAHGLHTDCNEHRVSRVSDRARESVREYHIESAIVKECESESFRCQREQASVRSPGSTPQKQPIDQNINREHLQQHQLGSF